MAGNRYGSAHFSCRSRLRAQCLLYNFRERRFVLVHHLRGDSLIVAFHTGRARPFCSLFRRCDVAAPCVASEFSSIARAGLVSRPRSLVRDVRARRVLFASLTTSVWPSYGCERDGTCHREEAAIEWDDAMAVSQPRPPDRVDAAFEKVAPLRYLEAHECVRSVTRYYHKPLS